MKARGEELGVCVLLGVYFLLTTGLDPQYLLEQIDNNQLVFQAIFRPVGTIKS